MKSYWFVAVMVLVCVWSSAQAAQRVEESAPFGDDGRLEVSLVGGSIEVRGWNRKRIEVSGELKSDRDRLRFEVSDREAFVGVFEERERRGRRYERKQNADAELVIRVPRSTRVAINTVSAEIDVEEITANQRLESVSGSIESALGGAEGSFRTVSGEIEVEVSSTPRRLEVHTVSGDVELRGAAGELHLSSVSGDFDVLAKRFSRLRVNTVSGDLEFAGELEAGGSIDMESVNGDMRVELPSLYDTEFHLETFNGDIARLFDFKPVRQSRYAPGRILRLTEGDGTRRIRIETLNGDIDVIATRDGGREPRISNMADRAQAVGRDDRDDEDDDEDDSAFYESDRPGPDDDTRMTDQPRRGTDERRREIEDFDAAMEALEREMQSRDREPPPPR